MLRCPYCLEDIPAGADWCPHCAEPLEPAAELALATPEQFQRLRDLRKAARWARNALSHGLLSLVCSLTCCTLLLAPSAIVYGVRSIARAQRHGEAAPGRAVAGIVLGGLSLLVFFALQFLPLAFGLMGGGFP